MLNRNSWIAAMLLCSCGAQKKLEMASNEITQLQQANNSLTGKVNSLQQEVTNLTEGNKSVNAEFSKYRTECEQTKQELAEVEGELTQVDAKLVAVMQKVETALADFNEKGVDVYKEGGLLYVSLHDELLYKSGSAALGAEGKKALGSLAAALNDYPDLKIIIIGNTDDAQFKKGGDNWSLSTARANGVARILRDEYKLNPARMTVAGRGKYAPVADNSTAEGRAKNRRTEIVLNPDLKKLWASVEQ